MFENLIFCVILNYFADLFQGVPCSSDGECAYLSTTCNMGAGVCNVKPLAEVEADYVHCYLDTISSSVEVRECDFVFLPNRLRN